MKDDSVLIGRILKGDKEAFDKLLDLYQNRVYGFLFHMTLSKEDAEDLTQDTFINVYKNLYKFNKNRDFLPWVFKIALNLYRNQYKKNKKKSRELCFEELSEQLHMSSEDGLLILEEKESLKEILLIIDELKRDQKEIFILKYSKGFTFKVIGEITGISEDAARMKYFRARENLVKKILSKRSV